MNSWKPSFMSIKILVMTPISRTINFVKQTKRLEPALYWANEIRICYLRSFYTINWKGSFLYSNNFIFENDVAANVIIIKEERKKFCGSFSHFWACGTKNWINTRRSTNHDWVEIKTWNLVCIFRLWRSIHCSKMNLVEYFIVQLLQNDFFSLN